MANSKSEKGNTSINGLSIVSLLLSIAAIVFALLVYLKNDSIVYVDSLRLLTNYKGAKIAKEAYEKKVAVWKANIDTLTSELNRDITKYEKEKKSLTGKEQKLTEELLGTKQQQLVSYRQATSDNAAKEDKEVTTQVFKEVIDFLDRYGQQHGYQYILGTTNMGNILYSKKINDITDEALKKLNEEYRTPTK